jgi:hypothetical protein
MHGQEDSIKMDLMEVEYEGVDCMHLAQDMDQWHTLVNPITKLLFP